MMTSTSSGMQRDLHGRPLWTWSFKHLRVCCSGTWSWRLIISSRCAKPIAAGKKAGPSPQSKYFQGIMSGWSLTAVGWKLLWWSRPNWCLGVACTTPILWLETLWSMGLWPVAIAVGSWMLGCLWNFNIISLRSISRPSSSAGACTTSSAQRLLMPSESTTTASFPRRPPARLICWRLWPSWLRPARCCWALQRSPPWASGHGKGCRKCSEKMSYHYMISMKSRPSTKSPLIST